MKLRNKLKIAKETLEVKFLKKKIPIAVTWAITNTCNLQCRYCGRWKTNSDELSTQEAKIIIEQLAHAGCMRISFLGGEPLLRKDIGDLINFCKAKGISISLISNGYFVAEKISKISNIDLLELSIDGINDEANFLRGKGLYERVLTAFNYARGAGVKTVFKTVLTKYNLHHIGSILEFAVKCETGVMFGPVSSLHFANEEIKELFPDRGEFRRAIEMLMCEKKRGKPIINSMYALRYMRDWPYPHQCPCFAGRAFCHIAPNGMVYPCAALEGKIEPFVFKEYDFKNILRILSRADFKCDGCWCKGTLEFNYLLALKPSALLSLSDWMVVYKELM
ncbi:MAG: hypothetical protein A2Y00_07085 [Omnitrophica WOR_2 bacterium GWF2_43_52]|nr:MAG: hypothetical protein A2Y00_07085 [Omnitrophica WOR_2 bacterium GWF2_43_52]